MEITELLKIKSKISNKIASDDEYEAFIGEILKTDVSVPMLQQNIPQLFISPNGSITVPVFLSKEQLSFLPQGDVFISQIPFLKVQNFVTGRVNGIIIDPFENSVYWDKELTEMLRNAKR